MKEPENLQVIDTQNVLTKEELMELKRLAKMSMVAKWMFAIAVGVASLFGIDKVADVLKH